MNFFKRIFNNIKNNSNVALDNFTWHDSLPIETKLQKVYTGTWSQNLTYSVKYKTNFESTYRLVADNLFTTQVYELDFTNIALQRDEYITDIVFEFGTVEAGFTQVQAPFIYRNHEAPDLDKIKELNKTQFDPPCPVKLRKFNFGVGSTPCGIAQTVDIAAGIPE